MNIWKLQHRSHPEHQRLRIRLTNIIHTHSQKTMLIDQELLVLNNNPL